VAALRHDATFGDHVGTPDFDGVGTKDRAGYGFAGRPDDPPGFRERLAKQREARRKAEEAVGT